jgi:hypothetical protein
MGWPLGDPAYEVDRHQAIRHSRDWCRLIAVVLHEAAVPVSAMNGRSRSRHQTAQFGLLAVTCRQTDELRNG